MFGLTGGFGGFSGGNDTGFQRNENYARGSDQRGDMMNRGINNAMNRGSARGRAMKQQNSPMFGNTSKARGMFAPSNSPISAAPNPMMQNQNLMNIMSRMYAPNNFQWSPMMNQPMMQNNIPQPNDGILRNTNFDWSRVRF